MNEAKVNILLVDDSPESLTALEATLARLGQNMIKAHSGEEALKCLLKDEFAVILLDVRMPGMDGFETATLIQQREKSRHTPIIFLTGVSVDENHVFEGYSLGAVDYMLKPLIPEIVRAKVSVFIELFRQRAELVRANAELASSKAFLAAVLDSTADAILVVNDHGTIRSVNQATRGLFGYCETELLNSDIGMLLSAPSWASLRKSFACKDFGGGGGGGGA